MKKQENGKDRIVSTMFTNHYVVRTTPKRTFRKNFIAGALLPILAICAAASTHYSNCSLTKSKYLGAFLGSVLGVVFWLILTVVLSDDYIPARIVLIVLYFGGIIAHSIYTRVKERNCPDEEIFLYRKWR